MIREASPGGTDRPGGGPLAAAKALEMLDGTTPFMGGIAV